MHANPLFLWSQQRILCFVYGLTAVSFLKFWFSFSAVPEENKQQTEIYFRLKSIFAQNKYGYNTRFMSDFDLLLESALNERFVDESTAYYDNPIKAKEIEDMEQGLNGEFAEDDLKDLVKDKSEHGSRQLVMRYPGRVGSNYQASDDLSIYKTHPSGSGPKFWAAQLLPTKASM